MRCAGLMRALRFGNPVMRVLIGVNGSRRANHVIASIVRSAHGVVASGVDISGFVTTASMRSRSTLV
jgi:hypothetical protein